MFKYISDEIVDKMSTGHVYFYGHMINDLY